MSSTTCTVSPTPCAIYLNVIFCLIYDMNDICEVVITYAFRFYELEKLWCTRVFVLVDKKLQLVQYIYWGWWKSYWREMWNQLWLHFRDAIHVSAIKRLLFTSLPSIGHCARDSWVTEHIRILTALSSWSSTLRLLLFTSDL